MPSLVIAEAVDTTVAIDTPERVRFRHRLAGPGRRGAAWLADAILRWIVLVAVAAPIAAIGSFGGWFEGLGTGLLLVLMFVLEWFYGAFFETLLSGRTPGKWALSLRVVRTDGGPAAMPDFVLRNLLRAVDWLPFGFVIGVLAMTVDLRLRRLGDVVAGTLVVVEEPQSRLGVLVVEPPITEAERQALPARVVLTRDERLAIEAWLRRRRALSPERVEELAALLGPALSKRTGIEAPTWSRVLVLAWARATGRDA